LRSGAISRFYSFFAMSSSSERAPPRGARTVGNRVVPGLVQRKRAGRVHATMFPGCICGAHGPTPRCEEALPHANATT
jgi:hypothetical protein